MNKLFDIEGFENLYAVTKSGDVWSYISNKFLKKGVDKCGYNIVMLRKNNTSHNKKVHRLIAQTFIENTENKPQVNHKNGIKIDNRVENLEWCTAKENVIHAYKNGLINQAFGERQGSNKLKEDDVIEIKGLFNVYSNKEIAKMFDVSVQTIWGIKKKKTWCHIPFVSKLF